MTSSGFFTSPTHESSYKDFVALDKNSFYSQLFIAQREGKRFIVKCLKSEYRENPIYEGLLRKEFEIGYSLDHPNICKIYEYIPFDELGNAIVMEYIDARTLSEYIGEQHSITQKLGIIRKISEAMSYAHKHQVIHRDLKPENILITHNGNQVKIIDFGLSDTDYHYLFKGGAGSAHYAAPELIQSGKIDLRCDIYSIGAIANKLFEGKTTLTTRKLVARCMQHDANKRYSSCDELIAATHSNTKKWIMGTIGLAVCLTFAALFYTDTQKVSATEYQEAALPSAELDGVSEEEFQRRQAIVNNFNTKISRHYANRFTETYKVDPFSEKMPDLDLVAAELLNDYKQMMDDMLGEIKHSSLYRNAEHNRMANHSSWCISFTSSFPNCFWISAIYYFNEAHDYPSIEYDELFLATKEWVISERKKRNLPPLPNSLLEYEM